jgi:signal transduction histidine kinase
MPFQLVRSFTIASLTMFVLVAAVLTVLKAKEGEFFEEAQSQQIRFFNSVQENFARQQDQAALRDLLSIHESANVSLARLFANSLWERNFAPYVARAQSLDVDACRALPDNRSAAGKAGTPLERKACFSEIGRKLEAFKEFKELDARVFEAMRRSSVFKVKVFDLRGITIYSSEHGQMGEDKVSNAGWIGAALEGKASSELIHRDRFSAFEGVVENRDLISSYLPILAPGSEQIVAVFEVYADVTPFLAQMKNTSDTIKNAAAANQSKVEQVAEENAQAIGRNAKYLLASVVVMLALLFASLFAIVRRADRIIVQQAKDRERALQQSAQSEKMASLGQMVAGVTHQLNTPLAFSKNNVSMAMEILKSFEIPLTVAGAFGNKVAEAEGYYLTIDLAEMRPQLAGVSEVDADVSLPMEMLGDTLNGLEQMRELVENLGAFTRLDRAMLASFNLNKGLHNVVYLSRSVAPASVTIVEDFGRLPMMECNPSQLNQVFLNLINNATQSISGTGTVTVRSRTDGGRIRVDIIDTGSGIPDAILPHIFETYYTTKAAGAGTGLGLAIAREIVQEHGGEIRLETKPGVGTSFSVFLPIAAHSSNNPV